MYLLRYAIASICAGSLVTSPLAWAGGRWLVRALARAGARTDDNPGAIGLALTTNLLTVVEDKEEDFP